MIKSDINESLGGAEIAAIKQSFFGEDDSPHADSLYTHLAAVQNDIANGRSSTPNFHIGIEQITQQGFSINPVLASRCMRARIVIDYPGTDRDETLTGERMMDMCRNPVVQNVCKGGGSGLGRLDSVGDSPLLSVPGSVFDVFDRARNTQYAIPVTFTKETQAQIDRQRAPSGASGPRQASKGARL